MENQMIYLGNKNKIYLKQILNISKRINSVHYPTPPPPKKKKKKKKNQNQNTSDQVIMTLEII